MTRVAILLFDQCDLLDVGGPYEVFLTASRLTERDGHGPAFEVLTASPDGEPVISYGGMGLVPTMAAADVGPADVVIVPGAIAINEVCATEAIQTAAARMLDDAQLAASVCTGAFLLGDRGMLDGLPWTTHHEDVADLAERIGSEQGKPNVRWIDNGDVVTSGGLSSGIAMALHLVDRLHGRDLAVKTAAQIEYVWDPDDGIVAD